MRFSMLYSREQILSFKLCLVFYAGDSLIKQYKSDFTFVTVILCNKNLKTNQISHS